MADLVATQKVPQYVILPPKRDRAARLVAATVIVTLLLVIGFLLWKRKTAPTHTFNDLPLPTLNATGKLKIKWMDGAAHYIFRLDPAAGESEQFNTEFQASSIDLISLKVRLLDSDGFELCTANPSATRILGAEQSVRGLRANAIFQNCSREHFEAGQKWDVTFSRLPHANANPAQPAKAADSNPQDIFDQASSSPTRTLNKRQLKAAIAAPSQSASVLPSESGSTKTKLTGRDPFSGEIETLDLGSYIVSRSAEKMSLATWLPGAHLSISCKDDACVVTNTTDDISVHSRKK